MFLYTLACIFFFAVTSFYVLTSLHTSSFVLSLCFPPSFEQSSSLSCVNLLDRLRELAARKKKEKKRGMGERERGSKCEREWGETERESERGGLEAGSSSAVPMRYRYRPVTDHSEKIILKLNRSREEKNHLSFVNETSMFWGGGRKSYQNIICTHV